MKKIYLSYSYDLVPPARAWHSKYRKPEERPLARRVFGPPQRKPLSLSSRRARSGTLGVSTIFLENFFHTERIEGDTILDGVAYKKLYDGNVVEGFLREENGKVLGKVGSYYDDYDTSDWSSHLVYDFSLGKGDTTVSHDYFRLNVNTVDTILVDGEPYRRLGNRLLQLLWGWHGLLKW